jgi:diacylglycerol kinase family enzyme
VDDGSTDGTPDLLESFKTLSDLHPYRMTIKTAEGECTDDFIFGAVSNALSVGGLLKLNNSEVDLGDGLFEVIMIREPKSFAELQKLLHDIAIRRYDSDQIISFKSSDITMILFLYNIRINVMPE